MNLFTNELFITLLLSLLVSHAIKLLINFLKLRTFYALDLVSTGGMPSGHSTLMAALSTAILLQEGATTSFFIAGSLSLIVFMDAMSVRRTAGEEGTILHEILKRTHIKLKEPHYALGHTPLQVFVGILLGIIIAVVVHALRL